MRQTDTDIVAGNVRAELARRKISGRELAERLGWHRATTARRLNGDSGFSATELHQVAQELNVPLGTLMAGLDVPSPRQHDEAAAPLVS